MEIFTITFLNSEGQIVETSGGASTIEQARINCNLQLMAGNPELEEGENSIQTRNLISVSTTNR